MARPNVMGRISHAINTLFPAEREYQAPDYTYSVGPVTSVRPDRPRTARSVLGERTIIAAIYTRLSTDIAGIKIEHCRVGKDGQYQETIDSHLNDCLNVEANIDQAARHLRQDMALTLFQEGVIAIVPIITDKDPTVTTSWDVKNMRVGTIVDWAPQHVTVSVYNERLGIQQNIRMPKSDVAIVENPFYNVMNEPNSTLQRLIRKLSMLDHVDEIASSGKLDIIIQLPYQTRSETTKNRAETRRREVEEQLAGSTYGIAYMDSQEKITQLNRSVENNLLKQVQYLKDEVYNELGLTEGIMNGTADDNEMNNYTNRVLEPVMDALVEAMIRTFLTKTARSQGQTLLYFQNVLKLIPIGQMADLVDVLSRNQVITPNEVRPTLGLKPSESPQANALVNSNMPLDKQISDADLQDTGEDEEEDPADAEEAELDAAMARLGI